MQCKGKQLGRLQLASEQTVSRFVHILLFIPHSASSHHLKLMPQAFLVLMCCFPFFIFSLEFNSLLHRSHFANIY